MQYAFKIHRTMQPEGVRTVLRDETALARSGLRYSSTPEGGCLEMTFEVVNTVLLLQPLDTVTLEYQTLSNEWVPLWKGEVREGGNVRDPDLQPFRLYGLRRLLEETPLVEAAYAQADVAVIVRQALRDALAADHLPPSVSVDDADIPLTGVEWAISRTAQQPVSTLLDAAATRAGGWVWGVRADGRVYFQPPRTDLYAAPTGAVTEWRAPSAERPCTAVLWFFQHDGTPGTLTHVSALPGARGTYGLRTRRVTVNLPFPSAQSITAIHAELDAWAQNAYALPARTPARITVPRLLPPTEYRGQVSLPGVAGTLPVAAWETTITAGRGVETHINAEQQADAGMESLARAIERSGDNAPWRGAVVL